MKAIKYIFILAATAFTLNSCTKQVAGPTGPTGPQGPQGASSTYDVTIDSIPPSAWSAANSGFIATIPNVTGLKNPNFAIVEVYFSTLFNSQSTWFELPASNIFASGDAFDFYYQISQVTVEYGPSQPAQMLYFKVVVINQP